MSTQTNGSIETIEIWADVACPFCYIGKHNFERGLAMAGLDGEDGPGVVYRSYQLDPEAPRRFEGDIHDMLASKYGRTREQAMEMNRHMQGMAEAAGVEINLDSIVVANTFDAHRLLQAGIAAGRGPETMESLLSAYFREGLDVGDHEVLVTLGTRAGLDADVARSALDGDSDTGARVWADIIAAQELGISAVPAFVFDRRALFSGAQKPEGFAEALERLTAAPDPLTVVRGGPGPTG